MGSELRRVLQIVFPFVVEEALEFGAACVDG
jgi:hypothetical protein